MTSQHPSEIAVVGAGLAGSMTALLLSRLGHKVSLFEKREDLRTVDRNKEQLAEHGAATSATKRSINLALSARGIHALNELGLLDRVMTQAIPMYGRIMHDRSGRKTFQPYGQKNQCIYSISRTFLNFLLLDEAEASTSVRFFFHHKLVDVDKDGNCTFEKEDGSVVCQQFALVIGADGAYSAVREKMLTMGNIDFSRKYIAHGYKELTIPPTESGDYALSPINGLHIWPRSQFMLIALPNPDKSFTATLFAPYHGEDGFDSVNKDDPDQIIGYFQRQFPDVLPLMPNLIEDYQSNPVGSLVTVRLNPWYKGRIVVLGDAAHAVVPFYGQGMNAAFEDALRLYMHVKDNMDVLQAAKNFADERVPAANALADLSFQNYTEMAHHTASSLFLIRKRIEGWLNYFFPSSWIPQYSMVSFTTIPYHVVVQRARRQDKAIKAGVWIASLLASVGAGVGAWYFRKRLRL